jgi:hypothetical protein
MLPMIAIAEATPPELPTPPTAATPAASPKDTSEEAPPSVIEIMEKVGRGPQCALCARTPAVGCWPALGVPIDLALCCATVHTNRLSPLWSTSVLQRSSDSPGHSLLLTPPPRLRAVFGPTFRGCRAGYGSGKRSGRFVQGHLLHVLGVQNRRAPGSMRACASWQCK